MPKQTKTEFKNNLREKGQVQEKTERISKKGFTQLYISNHKPTKHPFSGTDRQETCTIIYPLGKENNDRWYSTVPYTAKIKDLQVQLLRNINTPHVPVHIHTKENLALN